MGKYRPAVILTLAITVFLASCTGISDDPKWVVTTFASGFNSPRGMAVRLSSSGNLENFYVADTGGHLIKEITPAGKVTILAGSGTAGLTNDIGTAAQFDGPRGVAVDSSGNVYVADTENHLIRKITITTSTLNNVVTKTATVTRFAGKLTNGAGTYGFANGAGLTEAQFNRPLDVAVDGDNVYVADTGNHLIRKITFTTVNDVVTAAVSTLAGSRTRGFANGAGTEAQFAAPVGVAVDGDNLYVADMFNSCIRKIIISKIATSDGVSTLAGQFNKPSGVAVDSSDNIDNIYVADLGNNRIRKITITTTTLNGVDTKTATVSTVAGSGAAALQSPSGVAVVGNNIYVTDTDNHRIRKIELK